MVVVVVVVRASMSRKQHTKTQDPWCDSFRTEVLLVLKRIAPHHKNGSVFFPRGSYSLKPA